MSFGSRARRYPPPFPFRLCSMPWFLRTRRISSRNLAGMCSSRARSAMRIGSSRPCSASARRALIAYFARFDSMRLHVPVAPKHFQAAAARLVLGPPRPLGDVGELAGLELQDNVVHVARVRLDRMGAGPAAERAVALTVALVVVQRH